MLKEYQCCVVVNALLRTKMHVYKLETDNAQLSKQVRQFTEQAAEFNSRLKNDSSRLSDGIITLPPAYLLSIWFSCL